MKKTTLTKFFMLAGAICLTQISYGQDYYHGNTDWSVKSEEKLIIDENFQDWTSDVTGGATKDGSDLGCSTNARADVGMYRTFEVIRPVDASQGVTGGIKFTCDFCLATKDCDTQSGSIYTEYFPLVGDAVIDNKDCFGPSWNNVSVGSINIYDNYLSYRPIEMGVGGEGRGSITTSKISRLERIQYTTSSYGRKRGFHLEYGFEYEGVIYWDTLRYVTGSAESCRPDAVATELATLNLEQSNVGWVFEEVFSIPVENVYLRFRPTSVNAQIVRIHDLKLFGGLTQEDANSIEELQLAEVFIKGANGIYSSTKPVDVVVYNISGSIMKEFSNTTNYDISDLNGGIYVIQAITREGQTAIRKIVL